MQDNCDPYDCALLQSEDFQRCNNASHQVTDISVLMRHVPFIFKYEFKIKYIVSSWPASDEMGPESRVTNLLQDYCSRYFVKGISLRFMENNHMMDISNNSISSLYLKAEIFSEQTKVFPSVDDFNAFGPSLLSSCKHVTVRVDQERFFASVPPPGVPPIKGSLAGHQLPFAELNSDNVKHGDRYECSFMHPHDMSLPQTMDNTSRRFNDSDSSILCKIPTAVYQPLGLLSFILTSISVGALCIAFLTYLAYPHLRNLPGKITMNLVVTLGLAQILFLVSSESDIQSIPMLCQGLAIASHYFWMCSFFWLLAASLNIAVVFCKIAKTGERHFLSSESSLWVFMALGYGGPLPIVGAAVVLHFCDCSGFEIGYGYNICLMSQPAAIGYFFAIPLGVILIVNTVCFSATIHAIRKVKTSFPSLTRHCRSNGRGELFVVCLKLFFLMGFTWVTGFLAAFTDNIILWYCFAVFNCLQGVSVCFASLFSDKVRKSLRASFKSRFGSTTAVQ